MWAPFDQALALLWGADPGLLQVLALSLSVSGTAALLASLLGLPLAAWLALAPGRRRAWVLLLNTALALPSVLVGLGVYLLLSRSGPLGGWGLLFTPWAMILAQTMLVLPVVAALARARLVEGLEEGGEQLRSLGASPWLAALLMLVHLRRALLVILLSAFGRAIAEVGAVMVVGGNIEGFTRVMTTSIALETSKGDLPRAIALGLLLLLLVGLLNALSAWLQQVFARPGKPLELAL
ncbi:ABC-type tungstate transport system substrate-binding protein [Paucibacter oligotrophus]|uniref:ABC-type tungstate transport system substrate-binding protein n=1 Tax=Roseateles oligotrophus TaxID=1769250 RepID=A0A840L150_9BURK|nr:ABC transporter permease [Roseateles oligotrophus]MBB4841561.1 ABC-type tungstate transport system substrate-binding protein [Roseateles oligotrophus]